MKIKNISVIVGTRPQIIKSQPLVKTLISNGFDVEIVHSGQHYDYQLSQKFFKELQLPSPSVNLGIGVGSQLQQIAKIITKLELFFLKKRPDFVIIPGDTTSAIAAAIAASKCKIKFSHLEAGARSYQFHMSEEINRRLIDHSADILFAPTKRCLLNLKNESVFGKTFLVGDTMYDLFLTQYKKHKLDSLKKHVNEKWILVTIHRAENVDKKDNLRKICSIINNLYKKKYSIIFPIHPHTRRKLKEFGFKIDADLIDAISYVEMLKLLARSTLVITDSGGLQKETYWMGRPCITLRDGTEWLETVEEKANFLSPLSRPIPIKLISNITSLKIRPKRRLFGNGMASKKIANIILGL